MRRYDWASAASCRFPRRRTGCAVRRRSARTSRGGCGRPAERSFITSARADLVLVESLRDDIKTGGSAQLIDRERARDCRDTASPIGKGFGEINQTVLPLARTRRSSGPL